MTEDEFWKIVDSALIDEASPFFLEDHYLSYWNALEALPDKELAGFAQMHSQVMQRALARNLPQAPFVLNQGWSDQDLQNLLTGLISRGRKVFSDFLLDPEGALQSIDRPSLLSKCEAFGYAPVAIYWERTGKSLFDYVPALDA
ncbi:MAG: hypothetical protein QG574_4037 [Cyanobacteriota bacterium erpe_2018_sw_21hr_WHONDRS-SW48-000092_B_bin.40]|jgi:hypothetical protein|nr:hypothetical protein [Cyanobacteriota bacterium erpe_2018_sw_21hr_WHONDRS-SW48-000092_B_bin.40]